MCVFSNHSVVKDPPFSRLDLVSCRNLLIYLNADLQERVVRMFHYALRPGGILFLGPSEGVTRGAHLFEPIDAKHRLFRRSDTGAATPCAGFPVAGGGCPLPPRCRHRARLADRIEKLAHAALENIRRLTWWSTGSTTSSGSRAARSAAIWNPPPASRRSACSAFSAGRCGKPSARRWNRRPSTGSPCVRQRVRVKFGGETRAINVIVEPITVEGSGSQSVRGGLPGPRAGCRIRCG